MDTKMKNCKNCGHRYEIEKIKLFPGGAEHVYLNGYACTCRAEKDGIIEWWEDTDENTYCCSGFIPNKS